MTKQYPIVSLNNELYMIDKEAPVKMGEWCFEKYKEYESELPRFPDIDSKYSWYLREMNMNCAANDPECDKIVASSDKSLGLSLLPSVEEDFNQLAIDYNNSEEEKNKAIWNSKQIVEHRIKHSVDNIKKEKEDYLQKSIQLALMSHKGFGFVAGYKAASAKKWSDEDMYAMFQLGREFETNKDLRDSLIGAEEALESLQPKPIAVEVEMEENEEWHALNDFGTSDHKPKVKDNFVIVKRWIYE